jgi:hypothetical protein
MPRLQALSHEQARQVISTPGIMGLSLAEQVTGSGRPSAEYGGICKVLPSSSSFWALITGSSCCWPQERPDLKTYFKTDIGLSDDQIQAIRSGKAVAKNLPSCVPDEIFVFGAVYINATPDAYVEFSTDFTRL